MLVGLHGYTGSGKDAIATILVEQHGWTRVAFADALRSALLALDPYVTVIANRPVRLSTLVKNYGWDKLKRTVPEVRALLQRFGTEAGRNIHGDDVWVNLALRGLAQDGNYVITDARFPNEFAAIRARGGAMVNVLRPGHGPVNDHISEKPLACDYYLHNNSCLDALSSNVEHLLWWLRDGRAA